MKPAIVLAVVLLLTACGGSAQSSKPAQGSHASASTPMPSMSGMPTPSGTPAAAPAAAIATNQVTISNFAFSPAAITVKVGTTVTWTNQDQDAHTVDFRSGPNKGKVSQPMQMGDTYTFTFTQVGTIAYICSIHPFMKGTVEVTQ